MSPHASSPPLPSRPHPSADQGIQPPRVAPAGESDALPDDPEALDIWTLPAPAAARLLTAFVDVLIRRADADSAELSPLDPPRPSPTDAAEAARRRGHARADSKHHEDVPESHKTPIGSPELQTNDPLDAADGCGANATAPAERWAEDGDADVRAVLARKFAGKAAPPIALLEYIRRLHTYCPMSTAVYLAAGVYLERLTEGRTAQEAGNGHGTAPAFRLRIHRRNAHRLLLGALRVATQLLEDLSYAHARFARVGGVTERELTRLEVNFVFLSEFHLLVGEAEMSAAARRMRRAGIEAEAEAEAESG